MEKINWSKRPWSDMPKRTTKAEVNLWLELGMVKPFPKDRRISYHSLYTAYDRNGNKTALVGLAYDGVVYGATSSTHDMCKFF